MASGRIALAKSVFYGAGPWTIIEAACLRERIARYQKHALWLGFHQRKPRQPVINRRALHYALWLIGDCLKGTDIERQINVNSGQDSSPYSGIFLDRFACRYAAFEFSASMLEQAQALLIDYFDSLEAG